MTADWLTTDAVSVALNIVLLATDAQGIIVYASPSAAEVLGTESSELLGRNVRTQLDSSCYEVLDLLLAGVAADTPVAPVVQIALKDSDTRLRAKVSVIDGQGLLWEIKELDGAQRESVAQRMQRAADHLGGVVYEFRLTSDGTLVTEYISAGVEKYLGVSAAALLAAREPIYDRVHPEDRAQLAKEILGALQNKRPARANIRIQGRAETFHFFTTALLTEVSGEGALITGFGLDITEVQRMRKELRSSQALLHTVFENLPFECVSFSIDGDVTLQNPVSVEEFGDLRGKNLSDAQLSSDQRRLWELDIHRALSGQLCQADETATRNGTQRYHSRITAPIKDQGRVLGVVVVKIDTTQQRQLEQQLAHSHKLDAIGRLAGGVAHDFNNVLTAIMTCVRLLERRLDGGARRELQVIRDGGERAAELTRQLLAFAKQEGADPRPTSMNGVVNNSDRLLRRLIGEDIEMTTYLAEEDTTVVIDSVRLEQAIINLVVNARDALPEGGRIEVRCQREELKEVIRGVDGEIPTGSYASVRVRDWGSGMSAETKTRAFEPFFTTRHESGGTGLGLSSVYGTVKNAEGFIVLESEQGKGTSVAMLFPAVAEATSPEAVFEPGDSVELVGGSETILIVEDEPLVASVASQSLRLSGYQVLQAGGMEEALAIADAYEGKIDLLITDVVMPRGRGTKLARELKRRREGLCVLYMSGYRLDDLKEDSPEKDFLAKPFTPDELDRRVRVLLDQVKVGDSADE